MLYPSNFLLSKKSAELLGDYFQAERSKEVLRKARDKLLSRFNTSLSILSV
jgi:hypothetical protein